MAPLDNLHPGFKDKVCEFNVAVPNSRDALGDTVAKTTVRDRGGNKVAPVSKTFPVVR